MADNVLSRPLFEAFKQNGRRQYPSIKHNHLIEALACGFGFKSWAALSKYLDTRQVSMRAEVREFSNEMMQSRLVELGYERSADWPERFGIPDLVYRETISLEHWNLLRRLVQSRATIVVSGVAGSGKSSMLHGLLMESAINRPDEQFYLISEDEYVTGLTKNVFQQERDTTFLRNKASDEIRFAPFLAHYNRHSSTLVLDSIRDRVSAKTAFAHWSETGGGLATFNTFDGDERSPLEHIAMLLGDDASDIGVIDALVRMKSAPGIGIESISVLSDRVLGLSGVWGRKGRITQSTDLEGTSLVAIQVETQAKTSVESALVVNLKSAGQNKMMTESGVDLGESGLEVLTQLKIDGIPETEYRRLMELRRVRVPDKFMVGVTIQPELREGLLLREDGAIVRRDSEMPVGHLDSDGKIRWVQV